MDYAFNISDLTLYSDDIAMKLLLQNVTKSRITVDVEKKKIDGMAIFIESNNEDQKTALVQIFQDKFDRVRIYQKEEKSKIWKKLPKVKKEKIEPLKKKTVGGLQDFMK